MESESSDKTAESGDHGVRQRRGDKVQPEASPVFEQPIVYQSVDDYVQAVRTWMWAYHSMQLAQCMSLLNMNAAASAVSTQLPPVQQSIPAAAATPAPVPEDAQRPVRVVASYGRRLLAESIDGVFCFALKLIITYLLVEYDWIDVDKYDRLFNDDDESDLVTLVDVMHDLLPFEFLSKILVSFIEAAFVTYGFRLFGIPKGCTPGKFICGIRVISCTSVESLGHRDSRVTLTGHGPVSYVWSLMRAMMKNISLGFVFPICLSMYVGRHNRSVYDQLTNTIVVEA